MAIKDEVLGTKIEPQTPVLPEATPIPTQMTQDQLKAKIATGDFTASEARQYNQMTGSNTGARDVALTSQDAMRNQDFQTAVTPQEVGMMQDAGIKQVNSDRITLDTTAPQALVTPTPTKAETPSVKIESIEQFKQKGANLPNLEQFIEDRYGSTATQEDGGVTSVINGEKFKWTIDEAGNPIKTSMGKVQEDISAMDNADALYTSLLAGQVIPETLKTSNNYVKAQNRFNQYNQFKNLNQSQYQQLLAQGKLIPGTQAYNDLMNDPVAKSNIIKAQNLNAINQNQKADEKIASTENNQSDVILSNNPTVAQSLEDGTLSIEEYQALTNTPDITEKSKNVSKLKEEYIRLKSDYDAVEDEVLEEFKGKGKSGSYLRAKIQARRNSLFKELSLSEQLYTSAMGELTTMKNDATALLNTNLQLYKEQQSRQQQLEDRQYQEDLATRTMQRQYDYQFGDFNSEDPRIRDTAIRNAVAQLYTQYPIPGMEAPAVKEQKVKALMAQGLTGQQAISQLEQEIRSTNRYKQMIAPQSDKPFTVSSGSAVYDPATGTFKYPTGVSTSTGGATTNSVDLISKWEGFRDKAYQDVGGVWTYGHGFTKRPDGTPVQPGDTISMDESKQRLQEEINNRQNYMNYVTVPLSDSQKAALSSFEFNLGSGIWEKDAMPILNAINSGDFNKAGEIMKQYNKAGGKFVQGLQNRRNEEAQLLKQTGISSQYTDAQLGLLSTIDNLTPTTLKALGEAGLTSEDYGLFKNGGLPPTSSQKSSAKSMVNTINDLLANDNLSDAVGPFDVKTPVLSGKTQGFINKFNTLSANLTKDNLGVLKGPMSDKDVEFIKQMSGETQLNTDEETFKQNLIKLRDKYQTIADGKSLNQEILNGTQNTGTSTENAYNASNGKTYKIVINPN